jgi:hypothetical protein
MDNLRPIIRFLAGRLGAYLLAVAIAYVLATVTATQSVVASLDGMGVAVGLADRLAMTARDIRGMAPMFLPMVAFALLVAFLSAALLSRCIFSPAPPPWCASTWLCTWPSASRRSRPPAPGAGWSFRASQAASVG